MYVACRATSIQAPDVVHGVKHVAHHLTAVTAAAEALDARMLAWIAVSAPLPRPCRKSVPFTPRSAEGCRLLFVALA